MRHNMLTKGHTSGGATAPWDKPNADALLVCPGRFVVNREWHSSNRFLLSRRQNVKAFTIIGIIPLLFFSCLNPADDDNDGTTRISSGVKGTLLDANNNPVSGAVVRLYAVDYVPSWGSAKRLAVINDTTDEDGVYEIPDVDTGMYNIEGEKDSLGILIDSVEVDNDTGIIDVPPGQLKKLGKITGITHMPGQSDTNQVRVTLYIPGTNRITKPNIGGSFSFDLIPEGSYLIIIDPTLSEYNVKVIDTNLVAGEILDLDTVLIALYEPDTVDITTTSVFGTWGPNRVYRIFNTILIPDNLSLHIAEGTEILFMGDYRLDVDGSLIALGDSASFVRFSSGLPNAQPESWFGLSYWNSIIADTVILKYAIIEHSLGGLSIQINSSETKSITIANCIFRNNRYAIRFHDDISLPFEDTLQVRNSIIHNSLEYALSVNSSRGSNSADNITTSLLIQNCILTSNGDVTDSTYSMIIKGATLIDDFNCYDGNAQFLVDSLISNSRIEQDPMFVDTSIGNEDYHLQNMSPCIAAGINGTDMGIYSTYEP